MATVSSSSSPPPPVKFEQVPRLINEFKDAHIIYQTGMCVIERHNDIALKSGSRVLIEESNALRLASQLQLPVPLVYQSEKLPGGGASIRMDFIEGEQLDKVWPSMSAEQKKGIAYQLRAILDKMRAHPSDSKSVRACGGGEIRDLRTYMTYNGGPFPDEQSFNDFILDWIRGGVPKAIQDCISQQLQERCHHRIVFSHADLSPHNIMVKDGKIVALLDWENSGRFPEYWEYVKFFERYAKHHDWFDYAEYIFSETYFAELATYQAICRWHRS